MHSIFSHSLYHARGALVAFIVASCFPSSNPYASPILASDSRAPIAVEYLNARPLAVLADVLADLPAAPPLGAQPGAAIQGSGEAQILDTKAGLPLVSPISMVQPGSVVAASKAPATLSPDALRNVLRSIATIRRTEVSGPVHGVGRARGSQQPASYEYNQTAYLNLFDLVLDSELAGSALRALVDVKSTEDDFKVFSVLGLGEFMLEMETSARSAVFYELSSGWTASVGSGRNGASLLGYSADLARAGGYPANAKEQINYLQLALNWLIDALTSPVGVLSTVVFVMSIFLWSATKVIGVIQRRETASRRR